MVGEVEGLAEGVEEVVEFFPARGEGEVHEDGAESGDEGGFEVGFVAA